MKLGVAALLAAGAALLLWLIAHFGWHSVLNALRSLGVRGFGLIVAIQLGLIALMGIAWWLLGIGRPGARPGRFIWGRLIRDSASEALPLSQLGGYVIGARALAVSGLGWVFSAASTVVDVTVELLAQLAYTLLGLLLLWYAHPESRIIGPIFVATLVLCALACIFFAVQARGAGAVERFVHSAAERFLGKGAERVQVVEETMRAMHRRTGVIALAIVVHTSTWIAGGLETWVILWLMGSDVGPAAALVIDSLVAALRSFAFAVPGAVGVQEGSYVLLCGLFGISPEVALAMSLIRRGRDLVIGIPALLAWQGQEGRRLLRGAAR